MKRLKLKLLTGLLITALAFAINMFFDGKVPGMDIHTTVKDLPIYEGSTYTVLNNNIPDLKISDAYVNEVITPFQNYSDLDILGRSGEAYVCISSADMPNYERGSIQLVKPSAWQLINTKELYNITFEDDSFYLYNRCHIIGFQLTGIDEDHHLELLPKNLFTGTRQLNVDGMLPFENQIASYLRTNTGSYILYKATPIYEGANLLASGIQLQAMSLDGKIKFNVYIHNVQDGFEIDYLTGIAKLMEEKYEQ